MKWEVAFERFPIVEHFYDAINYEMELDHTLLETVREIIKKGNGQAFSNGIKKVARPFEKAEENKEHFILTIKREDKTHNFLFLLQDSERSKLVGISEKLTRDEVVDVLYDVLSEKIDEIALLI